MLKTFLQYRNWWQKWKTLPVHEWILAEEAQRKHNLDHAFSLYQAGFQKHGTHEARQEYGLKFAQVCKKLGKLREAEEELRYLAFCFPGIKEVYLELAMVQISLSKFVEAGSSLRKGCKEIPGDPELAGLLLIVTFDQEKKYRFLDQSLEEAEKVPLGKRDHPLYKAGLALKHIAAGEAEKGKAMLETANRRSDAPLLLKILLAQEYFNEEGITAGRQVLLEAYALDAFHPLTLSLLAKTYLYEGPLFAPDYALQLASLGCQMSGWSNPFALHVLAQAFFEEGEATWALSCALMAKNAGLRILGNYTEKAALDQLISQLS